MRVVNDLGIPVSGCVYFEYRGKHVSASNLAKHPSLGIVTVWFGLFDRPLFEGESIEEAINYIDTQLGAK